MSNWRRRAQMVGDGTSRHKMDYVTKVKDILNFKKFKSDFTDWLDFVY